MLKELRIRNLAIIDSLVVRFEKGLNILTGETGAGKSIIVDALGLALGDRAQSEFIKSGEREAVVQAYFELEDYGNLPDMGVDTSEGLVLRRVMSSGGKSKAYINDVMVTLQTLSEAGKTLVDIHSQHEHQSLLTPEKQMLILDSFGRLDQERKNAENLFREAGTLRGEYASLKEKVQERAHRLDLLRFQVNEIDSASIRAGEKAELEEQKKILSNITRLNSLAEAAYSLLHESEGSASDRLALATNDLKEIFSLDGSTHETLKMLESAKALIDDACFELRGYKDRYEHDPGRLEAVDDRLNLIKNLEKKYGGDAESILAHLEKAEGEIKVLETADDRLSSLEEELKGKEKQFMDAAAALSKKRKITADEIQKRITSILKELAFNNADFRIDVRQEEKDDGTGYKLNATGMDRIEFLFSANPGEPLKPLSKIISGGELSRLMLAIKSVLADVDNVPVLIFDEVDSGIGGSTAERVGKKLDAISEKHQLLCITHLPQIASFGDFHIRIEKKNVNGKVCVGVTELFGKDRQDEIARMLGGKITPISLKHAGEMLGRGNERA